MGRIRVHQLAASLGIPNKELIAKLQGLGFTVKTHSSSVDEDDARRALAGETATTEEAKPTRVRTVLRRRKKEDLEAEEAAAAEAEAAADEAAPAEELASAGAEPAPAEPDEGVEDVAESPPVEAVEAVDDVAEAPVEAAEPVEAITETPAEAVAEVTTEAVAEDAEVAPREAEALAEAAAEVLEETAVAEDGADQDPESAAPDETAVAAPDGASTAKPAPSGRPRSQVSKVVRVIDADAIKARLAVDGKNFAPRPRGGRFPQVRELHVVQDQFGRGPTMVDVTRDRLGRKGKKGPSEGMTRRDILEMRAGARDLWRAPGKKRKATKRGAKTEITQMAAHKRVIELQETVTVGDLAKQMAIKAGEVLRKLLSMGMMVSINQTIDYDTAAIIASEFGYDVKNVAFEEEELIGQVEDSPEDMLPRAPVVTIMGHVDHGKTSLLDAIRASRIVDGEAGGITQHIGAYVVETAAGEISFLDTPGHEAFTAMRMRGAEVTDVVVLVVAADDGVMPQTIEAINHSKSAKVPIIVAINKIDKPDATPDRVMQALTEFQLVPEAWGGDTMVIPVSAKEGTGISELLEGILLTAEVLDLRANPSRAAHGTIIEAQLDKGRGPVATVLVKEGTVRAGDSVVSGDYYGRVRAMYNDRGEQVEEAGPSTPVQVLGLGGVPNAGDVFDVVPDEKNAKTVAEYRAQRTREQELAQSAKVSLETFLERSKDGEALVLDLIVKADVQGSVEAVTAALERLTNKQVRVNIVHSAVGAITESDVNLASTSGAVIIGFGVRPDTKALQNAEQQKVDVRLYSIIYEAVDGVRAAMEGRLPTTQIEKYLGRAEVRQTFVVPKVGTIAGCAVIDGKMLRNARVRLLRDGVVMHDGKLSSLKRFKDDAREVASGYECGAGLEGYNDVKPSDLIEAYEIVEVATKLEAPSAKTDEGEERPQAGP